ncbi:hypothetical protein [Mycoplasmopsis columboralis]|uniref:Uncharacterized protein n=1 Tax=Mycoplasmopsis columboralis TaxID=171282 RepID=A0A449B6Y3_9BACT|nr:hypothetical protein [Mycoplasmopsis columboralis]VEU76371.1 Uncharacterised protein [Mycoplasmopsis columboralis]
MIHAPIYDAQITQKAKNDPKTFKDLMLNYSKISDSHPLKIALKASLSDLFLTKENQEQFQKTKEAFEKFDSMYKKNNIEITKKEYSVLKKELKVSQTENNLKEINNFVNTSFWEDSERTFHYFVENVARYRKVWGEIFEFAGNYNEFFTSKLLEVVSSAGEFVSSITENGGNDFIDKVHSGSQIVEASAKAASFINEKFILPTLRNLQYGFSSEGEEIAYLARAIREDKDVFKVYAISYKAYKTWQAKPWYILWISGTILKNNLWNIFKNSEDEIQKATNKWQDYKTQQYYEEMLRKYRQENGGY